MFESHFLNVLLGIRNRYRGHVKRMLGHHVLEHVRLVEHTGAQLASHVALAGLVGVHLQLVLPQTNLHQEGLGTKLARESLLILATLEIVNSKSLVLNSLHKYVKQSVIFLEVNASLAHLCILYVIGHVIISLTLLI